MNRATQLRLGIQHYEALLAVAETNSVTRAAELLHISQSAVSHRIGRMNQIANRTLVYYVGDGRGMQLTDDGRLLAQAARQVLTTLSDVERAVLGEGEVPEALVQQLERSMMDEALRSVEQAGVVLRLVHESRPG